MKRGGRRGRIRLMVAGSAFVVLAGVMGACSNPDPVSPAGSDPRAGTTLGSRPYGSAHPGTTAPTPGPPSGLVELRGDGLGVVSFGDAAGPTMAALESIYGPPAIDSGWPPDPAGRIRRVAFGPLVVVLTGEPGDERFSGWTYQPDGAVSDPMHTAQGATVGISFDELESRVGPTRPEPVASVVEHCWTEAGGAICALSSSRFASSEPAADERVSSLSAGGT